MLNKLILILVASLFSFAALAQAQVDEPDKVAEKSATTETRQTVEREVSEEEEPELDTFNPTEKINVDSSVSFPVDI